MGKLTAFWLTKFLNWDRPSQIGFLLAVMLLIGALIVAVGGPAEAQPPALIGALGSLIAAQAIFMWANRGMVTGYTRAQRLYLNEDFEAACAILEDLCDSGQADVRALTLLGNTYRQLGQLDESEAALQDAVAFAPQHPFPLYGLGRTWMAQGRYQEAAEAIELALVYGAPDVCRFDAGEAHYRLGNAKNTVDLLKAAQVRALREPHHALMTAYLLHKLGDGEPPNETLVASGLPYWQAQADLFADTPYGQALAQDIQAMSALPMRS